MASHGIALQKDFFNHPSNERKIYFGGLGTYGKIIDPPISRVDSRSFILKPCLAGSPVDGDDVGTDGSTHGRDPDMGHILGSRWAGSKPVAFVDRPNPA